MVGSDDSSPSSEPAKPKRSHHKKKTEPQPDGLATLAAAGLSAGDITESTSGALQMIGMALGSDRVNKPVMGAVIGKPVIVFDENGRPKDSKAPRADYNAQVLVKAAQNNKYIMRLLITVNKLMSGGELAKVVGDIVLAGAVDNNMVALDNPLVLMMIGKDIPPEVFEKAQAEAMAAAAAQVADQEAAA